MTPAELTEQREEREMAHYFATVVHHTIGRHYHIEVYGTLSQAKTKATKEFGDGFLDHTIAIYDEQGWPIGQAVAARKIREKRWTNYS